MGKLLLANAVTNREYRSGAFFLKNQITLFFFFYQALNKHHLSRYSLQDTCKENSMTTAYIF